jgi:hypothetical protein
MFVDVNQRRREMPFRHMLNRAPFARRARAHRWGHQSCRQSVVVAMAMVKRCSDGRCRVEVPPWLMSAPWWRSGRRVWMAIRRGSVCISAQPRGPRGAKRWSCRVRRVALTLARRPRTNRVPRGQKLSERNARRRMDIYGRSKSTSTLEVAQ